MARLVPASRQLRRRLVATFGQTSYRRFIVLSRSRTGSNMLVSFLDSHPNIRARGEVLRTLGGTPYTDLLSVEFSRQRRSIKANGFKVFYYHPIDDKDSDLLDHLAAMQGLYVLHLKRRNILRTVVSRKIAGLQDVWTSRSHDPAQPTDAAATKCVAFTVDELRREFEQTRRWENDGDALFRDRPLLEVVYEDLVRDPDGQFRRVTDFLDVPAAAPRTALKRQNPEPLRELIENFDELAAAFDGTEWRSFFDD